MKKIFKALAITAASAAMCVGVAMATGCTGGNGTYYGEYHYIGAHSPAPYGVVVEVTVENNIITSVKNLTNTDNAEAKKLQTYKDVVDGKEADEASYHNFTVVSPGWETYFASQINYGWLQFKYNSTNDDGSYKIFDGATVLDTDGETVLTIDRTDTTSQFFRYKDEKGNVSYTTFVKWDGETRPDPDQTGVYSYSWTDETASNWSDNESWVLQQYVGKSVADVLALDVYTNYGYALATVDGKTTQVLDKNSKGEPYGTAHNADLGSSDFLISGATQGSGRLLLAIQNALGK